MPVLIECPKKKNDSVNFSERLSPVEGQGLFSGAKTHEQILRKRRKGQCNFFFNLK